MARVVLILPTGTYRAPDFVEAAARLGAEVVVASDRPSPLAGSPERMIAVDLCDPAAAAEAIVGLDALRGVDAVVAVDDGGVQAAADAAQRLGLPHNPPEAVAATRDKSRLRRRLDGTEVLQPAWRLLAPEDDLAAAAEAVGGWPVVLKPLSLSASRGVIRADGPDEAAAAVTRVRAILADAGAAPDAALLLERFVPGPEIAVEGLLRAGRLEVLATFDKPDALDGPYFEETIYVTPSRHPAGVVAESQRAVARAAEAVGLAEGPIHAELRLPGGRPHLLEIAARSIGGLCARALRFGAGISLEEVILRHALGLDTGGLSREEQASGVMMLPIRTTGVLRAVPGREEAARVPGVAGVEVTVPIGHRVVALPEGDRYLGFVFARGATPAAVERALREAHARLGVVIEPDVRPRRRLVG